MFFQIAGKIVFVFKRRILKITFFFQIAYFEIVILNRIEIANRYFISHSLF
jgi:hypothetical protein